MVTIRPEWVRYQQIKQKNTKMFKLFIFALAICAASAGIIGHGLIAAPVAVAHAPIAQSYQSHNQISVHPVPVVSHVAHAAPVLSVAHAPLSIGLGHDLGHGYGIGLH